MGAPQCIPHPLLDGDNLASNIDRDKPPDNSLRSGWKAQRLLWPAAIHGLLTVKSTGTQSHMDDVEDISVSYYSYAVTRPTKLLTKPALADYGPLLLRTQPLPDALYVDGSDARVHDVRLFHAAIGIALMGGRHTQTAQRITSLLKSSNEFLKAHREYTITRTGFLGLRTSKSYPCLDFFRRKIFSTMCQPLVFLSPDRLSGNITQAAGLYVSTPTTMSDIAQSNITFFCPPPAPEPEPHTTGQTQ